MRAMIKQATFGAGCFWGVEQSFRKAHNLVDISVGYMGGHTKDPSYEQVCTDETGHAEVVHMEYDAEEISYEDLLKTFWSAHDPTTFNKQGPDEGSQYRSVIFYHDEEQKKIAEKSKEKLEADSIYDNEIVTEITLAGPFYRAEEYHQNYLNKK